MKRLFLGIMALLMLLTFSLPGFAETISPPPLSDLSPDPDFYHGSWSVYLRSSELEIHGVVYGIEKTSSTSVKIKVGTTTNLSANAIGGTTYLQKWDGTSWVQQKSRGFWGFNTTSHSDSTSWTVDSGFYYRIKTIHSASLNSETASRVTLTGAIWVN